VPLDRDVSVVVVMENESEVPVDVLDEDKVMFTELEVLKVSVGLVVGTVRVLEESVMSLLGAVDESLRVVASDDAVTLEVDDCKMLPDENDEPVTTEDAEEVEVPDKNEDEELLDTVVVGVAAVPLESDVVSLLVEKVGVMSLLVEAAEDVVKMEFDEDQVLLEEDNDRFPELLEKDPDSVPVVKDENVGDAVVTLGNNEDGSTEEETGVLLDPSVLDRSLVELNELLKVEVGVNEEFPKLGEDEELVLYDELLDDVVRRLEERTKLLGDVAVTGVVQDTLESVYEMSEDDEKLLMVLVRLDAVEVSVSELLRVLVLDKRLALEKPLEADELEVSPLNVDGLEVVADEMFDELLEMLVKADVEPVDELEDSTLENIGVLDPRLLEALLTEDGTLFDVEEELDTTGEEVEAAEQEALPVNMSVKVVVVVAVVVCAL